MIIKVYKKNIHEAVMRLLKSSSFYHLDEMLKAQDMKYVLA